MAGIDLGTAFLQIVPSFRGGLQESERAGQQMGRRAGEQFGDQFTREATQGLRSNGSRFEQAGQNVGERVGQGAQREMGNAGGGGGESFLSGFKGKAMLGIAGVAAAVGAAFMEAYTEALDVKKARAKATAQLGLTPKEAKDLGKVAGDLYATGYGESIAETTDLAATVQSTLGLTGDALTAASGKASSFAAAFDTDVSEAVQSVGTLMRSGLVKDADEAFDLLTAASQKVPAALRGNIAEASDEYGQFFNTLGFTGEEAFDALVRGAEKGEFGIDKTGDAIKEFTILSTDGSKRTVDAYESIGLNATEMSNAILAGGDQAKGATDKIIEGILGIKDPTDQAAAALALFGTPLEDMNVGEIPQFLEGLQGVSGKLGDTAGAAGKMDAAMGSTTSKFELFYRSVKTNVVDFFVDRVLPALADGAAWLGEKLAPAAEKVGVWFQTKLVPFLQLAAEWISVNLLPAIERLGEFLGSTFQNIMDALGGVMDFLSGVFSGDWEKAWEGIKSVFAAVWEQIKGALSAAWDIIVDLISKLGPKVLDIIQGFFGMMVEKGREFLGWLWDGIVAFAEETLWPWFTSLPGWAWDRIAAFAGWVVEKGREFLSWLWDGIKAVGEDVLNWFGSLPGWAWDRIKALGGWLVDRGGELIGWVKDGIIDGASAIWDFFTELPGKAWDALVAIKDKILNIGSSLVSWIVDGIKGVAGAIWDAITGALGGPEVNGDGTVDVNNLGVTLGGNSTGGVITPGGRRGFYAGGIVPGVDPGRRDNVLAVLPNGEPWGLRSEEAVMVPEFTRTVGGERGVHALNRLAEAGRLNEIFGVAGGFAMGGAVGTKDAAKKLGGNLAWSYAKEVIDQIKSGAVGGVNSNGNWGPVNMNGFAANTAAAKAFIEQNFSGVASIGGLYGGSVSGSDHPYGKALDVMISNYLSAQGIAAGTKIADWFVNNPNSFGTKYTIWRDRINNGGGWEPYSHPSGNNDTLAHRDHVHISFLTGSGEFSAGQPKGDVGVGKSVSALATQVMSKLGLGFGGPAGAAPVGSGVERWRQQATNALHVVGNYLGKPLTQHIDRMLMQMDSESSGNERAINLWDSNAAKGTPSMGLLQTIQPTFESALRGTPFANLIPRGPYDPWANMIASILYGNNRYGDLSRAYRGVAYAKGGIVPGVGTADTVPAMLTPGEGVFTKAQTEAIITHAKALANGYGGNVVVTIRGEGILTDAIAKVSTVVTEDALNGARDQLLVGMGQR